MANSFYLRKAEECLKIAKGHPLTVEQKRELAIELAGLMLQEARRTQTCSEKRKQTLLARMMRDPKGKSFATSMSDQCFRSSNTERVADQLLYLIQKFGVPKFLTLFQRIQIFSFKLLGKRFASVLVPLFKRMVRGEASEVILPGEDSKLFKHIKRRRKEGVCINLNHLGEAILGEEEAKRRLASYLNDLANPEVECISVKASALFSQINLLGWEETIRILGNRLKHLYRAAHENLYTRPDGKRVPKFVYLDMEEYRDLYLTVELFRNTLDDFEFNRFSAGIVLQAYLPDAFILQQELTAWAMERVAKGGAPIKIRIVKGANLAMEQVEASLRQWPQAPYLSKVETDANFKRMVLYGCELERANAVRLGIGSHNLFDIAFIMLLRSEKNMEKYVGFEMLEGMAEPLRRVVQKLTGRMLLYCPAATQQDFRNAVSYLTRRLDENTSQGNFLRYAFEMLPGTVEWQRQADIFSFACHSLDTVPFLPRRRQNRFEDPKKKPQGEPFTNEADTDWSLPHNVKWLEGVLQSWSEQQHVTIPLVLGDQVIDSGVEIAEGVDPSCPGAVRYRYALAGKEQLEIALETAVKGHEMWTGIPQRHRLQLIEDVAHKLRLKRGDLIGAMVTDTAKTVAEADVEVSEAIDFATYYRRSVEEFSRIEDLRFSAKGVVLVAPPWNFPCSIPAGGILAALATGNSVIFKPAPEAVLVGWHLVNAFWEAGISREVLQFFCCPDDPIAGLLVQDPRIAAVILTGATATAKQILKTRPGIDLYAETGGKNSLIITSMADRDLAIKDLIQSAFGYAGQKCSACSLAILEKEVYEDPIFRRQLRDAAVSMKVETPWHLSSRVNPLIRQASPALGHALTTLDEGEEWLLAPLQNKENPNLWSPGIKYGVKPGSFMHRTELFGPVLGVMCAADLQEAIEFANGTAYGLTAGIHTLDEREQHYWMREIVAGNCYINRTITGAIVQRQPFGGCKESSFGPGAKAGGPNYVLQMMHIKQILMPKEKEPLNVMTRRLSQHMQRNILKSEEADVWAASVGSYAFCWNHYFSKAQLTQTLLGEDNTLHYVPRIDIVLRVVQGDNPVDILRVVAAALTCNIPLVISCGVKMDDLFDSAWMKHTPSLLVVDETEEEFIKKITKGIVKRVRMVSKPSKGLTIAAAQSACYIASEPVLANGRVELLHYLREVCLSNSYHRYGYLGMRENGKI